MRGDGQRSGGLRARRALSLPPGAGMRGERFLERWTAPGSGFEAQSGPRATPWGFKCPTALSRGGVGGMGGQEAMGVVGTRGFCARFLNSERRKPSVAAHPRTPRWELGAGRGGVLVGAAARWFPAGRDLPAPGAGRGSGWVGVSGYGGLRCPSAQLPSPRTMNIHRAPSPSPRRFLLTVFHPFSPTSNPPPPRKPHIPSTPLPSLLHLSLRTRVSSPRRRAHARHPPAPTHCRAGGQPAPTPLSLPGACAGRGRGARPVGDRARDGTKPPPTAPPLSSRDPPRLLAALRPRTGQWGDSGAPPRPPARSPPAVRISRGAARSFQRARLSPPDPAK